MSIQDGIMEEGEQDLFRMIDLLKARLVGRGVRFEYLNHFTLSYNYVPAKGKSRDFTTLRISYEPH